MRTQVGIIGSGPTSLLLARLLHLQGIDTVMPGELCLLKIMLACHMRSLNNAIWLAEKRDERSAYRFTENTGVHPYKCGSGLHDEKRGMKAVKGLK